MTAHDAINDALSVLAIFNLVVSVAIARSPAYSGRQKILQILLVWIIPVVGGVLFGVFMLTQRGSAPPTGYARADGENVDQLWSGLDPPDQRR